ncbi:MULTISPECIES: TonB-dependent receptor domain-containing protein [Kordiimonas]|uniref:TonB-dependent receptor domain-containing protein n=1 Tax=Kordiimonas TaxID=288021 RepID=UPI00257B10C1|nr:TonB-dependent receptor [Kordiimonas sp. UBA4487]
MSKLAQQAGFQLLIQSEDVRGVTAGLSAGRYTSSEALTQLLAGTNLTFRSVQGGAIAIVPLGAGGVRSISYAEGYDYAQGVAASQDDERVDEVRSGDIFLEEIVVTATKRATSLQDTPMSIAAIGAEEIERRGLVGMGDYLNSVPGVSVLDGAAGRTSLVIRGASSNPQNEGESNGSVVGVYFGETPITGLASYYSNPDVKLVDMERVEVLRGPQGTLYGSSNLGGTIRNIPAAPNLHAFEGRIEAGYSHTGGYGDGNSELQGVVNIPLIEDRLALRVVGFRFENSGYYRNLGISDPSIAAGVAQWGAVAATARGDVGNDKYLGGRISLRWEPNEKLRFNLMYMYQDIDQDGWAVADLDLGEQSYLQRGYKMRLTEDGESEFNESFGSEIEITNATVEYTLGSMSLLSSTSWVNEQSYIHREVGPIFFGFIPAGTPLEFDNSAFIEEARLTSQFSGPFQFVLGMYYEDIENAGTSQRGFFGGALEANPFPEVLLYDLSSSSKTKQKALFGEVSYDILEQLKLTAGVRVFDYDREISGITRPSAFLPAGSTHIEGGASDSNYKVSLDYTPNRDSLFYVTWSQGFRLGRPVPANPQPLCDQDSDGIFDNTEGVSTADRVLDSDFVDNYELGGKFSLFDNRLRLNAGVYQVNWDKIPISMVAVPGCTVTVNAGKARSRGVEFEGTWSIARDLMLNFGASLVKAVLTEDAGLLGNSGDRLPGAPRYNVNVGLQYEFDVAGYGSFLRSDYYYVGGFYHNIAQTGPELGKYGKLNVRVGVDIDDHTRIELFANNLMDEAGPAWIDGDGFVNPRAYLLRPRTIGMNISVDF